MMVNIDKSWSENLPKGMDDKKYLAPAGGESLFEIRLKGHLNSEWSDWLESMEVKLLENGEMILTGALVDQAALMSVLNKLSSINLTILSINKVQQKKEEKMNAIQTQNRNLEAIAWGAIFIWWGITEMFTLLPDGTGAIGIGIILLGLNAVRHLNGIPTRSFTTTLGILALVWGGLELTNSVLSLPFELPAFAVLLIVLGVIVIGREFISNRKP